jgi:hypothetical protein
MRTTIRRGTYLAGFVLALTTSVTVLAADAVPTVEVTGFVVDLEGQSVVDVESSRIVESETPESDPITTNFEVAADGTFAVALREWGTPEVPAQARFIVYGPFSEPRVINDEGCTEMTQALGIIDLDIPGVVPTDPLVIVLDQTVVSGLCPPATATPDPEAEVPDVQAPTITLPPTDAQGSADPGLVGSLGSALLVGGVALIALASLLAVRKSRPGGA